MRRLVRRLFTLGSAVSLLLCVAVCVLWVRSHAVADVWLRQTADVEHEIRSDRGQLAYRRRSDMPFTEDESWRWEAAGPARGSHWAERLGFGSDRGTDFLSPAGVAPEGGSFSPLEAPFSEWWVPHWFLAAVAAAVPLVTGARTWRRTLRRAGLCPVCGYDLRASPERCPECGAAASRAGSTTG